MDLGIGYSYVRIKVLKTDPSIADQFADTGIPAHQINANVAWHLPIASSAGDLTAGANLSFKSRINLGSNTASGTGAVQPAYTLIDFRLQWDNVLSSNFSMGAFVKNVTNRFYRLGVIDIVKTTGIGGSIYGAPRTYGFTLGYKY